MPSTFPLERASWAGVLSSECEVNDKRVSRRHGLLNNQDGRLRLKPTHLNPCFLQSSLADDPRPLQKDVWCPLDHGDIFSLLPGQLMFRVAEVGGRTLISPLRVSATCEGYAKPVSRQRTPPTSPGCHGAKPEASNQEASFAGEALTEEDKVGRHAVVAPSPRKKRLLPSWMMAAVNSSSATLSRQAAKKSRQTELSDDKKTKVKRIRKGDGCADVASSHEHLANVEEDNEQLQDDDSVTMAMEQEAQDHGEGTSRKCDVTTRKCDIIPSSQQNTSAKAKEKDKSSSRLRTACPYGKDCYRSAAIPETLTMRKRRRKNDPSVPTVSTATGRILFIANNTNTRRTQLAAGGPPPRQRQHPVWTPIPTLVTASSTTTATTSMPTLTTPLRLTLTDSCHLNPTRMTMWM
ncbi:aprataxin and PNK-like factor isoform X3 [Phyllopteryx taeniolatus]|uniref:aprataxin and PNK-like factor isoform X3 n=1 Tax=Phyllopteryx taeniolatus TaxID=161469 RepID=UPI002AD4D414|nr:aprataxin and PNK-like factor isoform X3 [Phyllopteryx taeniolatus]XP_061626126.1 aprataxin and PNK-like factor isoform X3 [Phyllopteryx taeniolatus]XP_061626127.1 aprataxin and PNK-like factor isoform X3 [Phyllopteryx taeniolatus]